MSTEFDQEQSRLYYGKEIIQKQEIKKQDTLISMCKIGYYPTNLGFHSHPKMSVIDPLWVKKDERGYHYINEYSKKGIGIFQTQLKRGDKIGEGTIC